MISATVSCCTDGRFAVPGPQNVRSAVSRNYAVATKKYSALRKRKRQTEPAGCESPPLSQLVCFQTRISFRVRRRRQTGGFEMDVISVSHLTRDFGENRGIFDLSFTISQGETFGFLGPNGAGKTTLIRHLMGFLRPKSGSCRISGIDCWSAREKTQRQIGYLPGELSFLRG